MTRDDVEMDFNLLCDTTGEVEDVLTDLRVSLDDFDSDGDDFDLGTLKKQLKKLIDEGPMLLTLAEELHKELEAGDD